FSQLPLSLICIPFFLYWHLDHRVLHSFPTRRSSDLLPPSGGVDRDRDPFREVQLRVPGGFVFPAEPALLGPRRGGGRRHLGVLEDRKSTRLNSSHLGISYAVFCLKKKTQPDPHLHRH